jgi:site-specific DNA recombinase
MRAALYARFSTELQRKESIDDQYRACARLARVSNIQIVERYADEGVSGGITERPGYQALLAGARAGTFGIIITEDISRLWRSRAEFGQRSAELEDLNVHILTCVGDDTRRDGYGLMLGIKSAMAEAYRKEVSYRTRRGMEGLAATGKSTGGKCFGYGPGEAGVVRQIFALAAAGARPAEIARTLNREMVPGPRGPYWSLNAAKRILRNPRFAGRLMWGKTEAKTRAQDGRRGRPVERPEGPLVVRAIPALVDPLLWDVCNPGSVVAYHDGRY